MAEYSKPLAKSVKKYLDKNNYSYDFKEDKGRFFFDLPVECIFGSCNAMILVFSNSIKFLAYSPKDAEFETYASAVQYITRANDGMFLSHFEFDYEDGMIGLASYLIGDCEIISQDQINDMFKYVIINWETYGDGLIKVLKHGANPKEVIDQINENEEN